jgi:hypothetical protein
MMGNALHNELGLHSSGILIDCNHITVAVSAICHSENGGRNKRARVYVFVCVCVCVGGGGGVNSDKHAVI